MSHTPAQRSAPPSEPVTPNTPTDECSGKRLSIACRPVFSPEYRNEDDRFPPRLKYVGRGTVDLSYVFAKPPKAHQLKDHKPKPMYDSVESRFLPPLPPHELAKMANKARLATKAEAPITV
ncbi:hypothetical protein FRC08_016370 [Ceratobasidium sp. 394]|nr:hypothetical protein FRC08_016370 [Ceratobasidium sp. 394]KAG9088258.1 hypothetical protein FS749_002325 [Ceratobasidium sp. UAMH 11750]